VIRPFKINNGIVMWVRTCTCTNKKDGMHSTSTVAKHQAAASELLYLVLSFVYICLEYFVVTLCL
jgi:hypothetical protein